MKTREVKVGKVGVGGNNPIRIQSMTTTPTDNAQKTADEIMKLSDLGCEIVRVTVQGMKEAHSCKTIKEILEKKGYSVPLVADIHFYPKAALAVADVVDKVRINPGNFVDRRSAFKTAAMDETSYNKELEKIEAGFAPLVEKCKQKKKAIRIGTNHGSLSDRILCRFGDTPRGMVESALEFARIARKQDFHDLIFSMKASNPLVMIAAYRLLVQQMERLGWDYPLHVGVTEAGAGEDGRVKSAVGIGALLLDGIGDTLRVSLTEDPVCEIPPARHLASFAQPFRGRLFSPFWEESQAERERRVVFPPSLSLHKGGSVLLEKEPLLRPHEMKPDLILQDQAGIFRATKEKEWEEIQSKQPQLILFAPLHDRVASGRRFFRYLHDQHILTPVILDFSYTGSFEDLIIEASAECGALLADNLGEGILLRAPHPPEKLSSLSFSILQACRKRLTKPDFISCPGCGRTLFNLQEVAEKIRQKTAHLQGIKIAIMGCIVNGPGEMADADFGYVGSGKDKVDLYVKKKCVERGIDAAFAEERLIALIKKEGAWIDPRSSPQVELLTFF